MKSLGLVVKWGSCFMRAAEKHPRGALVLVTIVAMCVAPQLLEAFTGAAEAYMRLA